MPAQSLGYRAAAALKTARAATGTLQWDEVARIIDSIAEQAPPTAASPSGVKATVEAIYAIYPRKVGKEAALKAIARAGDRLKKREPDALAYLLERTRLYATAVALWPQDERQYCPHPATWFNQGRYDDNTAEWQRATAKPVQVRIYDKL